ncbi:hypothetical protein AYI69_g6008 [Smittium culicis]|uniref:Endonuclease/exonuclease/phosphatase domain-containing protein n=1 Tax=Smittium culicis TaxID=133412 RepID=A0A1R1Y2C0_9FUNG|nr:hypothetical protein AYI69_g6008 [Smittium culicis]
MPTLKIGFYNCNGLSHFKWEYVMRSFENDVFDIIFLAETWFVGEDYHRAHPYYVFSSKIDGSTRDNGRCKNGLMCLAKPFIKSQISNIESTTHTLNLCVYGHNIFAVYFPPSLEIGKIKDYVLNRGFSIMLGDLNTYFGSNFGQKRNFPINRIELFNDLVDKLDMKHVRPATDMDIPDHAFIDFDLTASWDKFISVDSNPSDHLLMVLNVDISSTPLIEHFISAEKINLSNINDPSCK